MQKNGWFAAACCVAVIALLLLAGDKTADAESDEGLPQSVSRRYVLVQDYANNKTSRKYLNDFKNALYREPKTGNYVNFGDQEEVFLISAAVPFEDGVLICAYEMGGGETYCDLYYLEDGNITYRTLTSDCWSFNYTVFKNHTIAYGMSSEGEHGFGLGRLPESVAVQFADGTTATQRFSNIPYKSVEGWENCYEGSTDGYIFIANGQTWGKDIKYYDKDGRMRRDWRSYWKETGDEIYAWEGQSNQIWNFFIFNVMCRNDYRKAESAVTPVRICENGEEVETEKFLLDDSIGLEYVWRNRNCYFRGISEVKKASEIWIKGLRDGDDVLWAALDRDDGSPIQDYATLCSREAPKKKGNYLLIVRHNGDHIPVFENMYYTKFVRIV